MESNINERKKEILLERFYIRVDRYRCSDNQKEMMKNIFERLFRNFCSICEGYGHQPQRCSLKRKFRNLFRRMGYSSLWSSFSQVFNQSPDEDVFQ